MTDTLTRVSNPTRVVKNNTGTSLYTIGAGVANVKHAIVANTQPWDAYLTLGLGALTTDANLLVPSVLVPAFKTVVVPLDVIVSNAAGDIIKARQSIPYQNIYGSASLLQTPAVLTNGTGNAGASATVVTGSWTEVNGTLYLLSVAWKKAGGAGTLDSFTDTHTGISWTVLKTVTSADGTQKLAVYAAVSTGTSATTTTANFSASQDASAIAVTNVALTGTFDSTTANGVDGLVAYGGGEDVRATTTPFIPLGGWPSAGSNRIYSMTNSAAAAVAAATGWTELNDVTTNLTLETAYSLGSTATSTSSVIAPTVTSGAPNLAIAVDVQEKPAPLVVSLYGVVVT